MIRRVPAVVAALAALAACQGYKYKAVPPVSAQLDNQLTLTGVPPNVMIVQDTSGSMCEPIQPADPANGTACVATGGGSQIGYCSSCQPGYSGAGSSAAECASGAGPCATKMQLTATAINDVLAGNGALPPLVTQPGELNLGLTGFPAVSGDSCSAGSVVVPIGDATNTITSIIGSYANFSPAGGTPTNATLQAAAADPAFASGGAGGKYIVLVTDGLPNCAASSPCTTMPWSDGHAWGCASPASVAAAGSNAAPPAACSCSFGSCQTGESSNFCCPVTTSNEEPWYCLDDQSTEATLTALNQRGIKTFVLGMGNAAESNVGVLNAMASAGGTGMAYQASTPAELQQQLKTLLNVGTCDYTIDQVNGDPIDPKLITVSYNHTELVAGDADGYVFTPPNSITIQGNPCTAITSGTSKGQVEVTAIAD